MYSSDPAYRSVSCQTLDLDASYLPYGLYFPATCFMDVATAGEVTPVTSAPERTGFGPFLETCTYHRALLACPDRCCDFETNLSVMLKTHWNYYVHLHPTYLGSKYYWTLHLRS